MIENLLEQIPKDLKKNTRIKFEKLAEIFSQPLLQMQMDTAFIGQLLKCLATSEFCYRVLLKQPQILTEFHRSNQFNQPLSTNEYVTELTQLLKNCDSEIKLTKILRDYRNKHMLRIAWRDLNNLATLKQTIYELSSLADVIITKTLAVLETWLQEKFFDDTLKKNLPEFSIIALGKLGSFELNFSSDVDLIFCLEDCAPKYEPYFTRLGQKLIQTLSKITEDGFVFRVDMRLRPYGSGGALICKHKTMQAYYQSQGREWERFALAKARLINRSFPGDRLMSVIKNFVYRRHTDFGIIDALRDIKGRMRRDSHGLDTNIKRGPGGIREIEFIVQVFQLIRGGHEPWFQNVSIFKTLEKIGQYQCLPAKAVQQLLDAYIFFRIVEHRLQQMNDQQTQSLPHSEFEMLQLSYALDYPNYDIFLREVKKHQENTLIHFHNMIAPPKDHQNEALVLKPTFLKLLNHGFNEKELLEFYQNLGCTASKACHEILQKFMNRFAFHEMAESAKPKLAIILQEILPLLFKEENIAQTLERVCDILEQILRRSIYLDLLIENPNAMVQLIKVCRLSAWIANLLVEHPFLLDELIDQKTLYQPYSTSKLLDHLRQYMLSIPYNDLEQQMDCLRRFKQIQMLRVAVSDITQTLPLMKISDHLTFTATVIVNYAQRIAWRNLTEKYGKPVCNKNTLSTDDFAIIAYGKLGGLELSYGSDLDLVFIHPDLNTNDMTDGDKSISAMQFFLRLAQRITHILSVGTGMGSLYEIDTRLRPSGQSGLLVSSFKSFTHYQKTKAWTWEHQALLRTRMITGNESLNRNFMKLRIEILTQKRDTNQLKTEIANMRTKMLAQQPLLPKAYYDINNGKGGIKDIEFIVQYLALNYAHQYPDIIEYSDNIRIIEALLEHKILDLASAKMLSDAYCDFRHIIHRQFLHNKTSIVEETLVPDTVKSVRGLWKKVFLESM